MSVFSGPNIINDGLALHLDSSNLKSYPGSGNTFFDISKSNASGILSGTYSFSNGSITFDRTASGRCDHSTNLSNIDSITNSSSFTFSSIFRINSYPPVETATVTGLLMKGSYNPSYGLNLIYAGDSGGIRTQARIHYGIRNLTGTAGVTQGYGFFSLTSNSLITLGQWYKVDMVHQFSETTHTIQLYINGVLDRSDTQTNALFPINFQNSASIGINTRILSGNFLYSDLTIASYSIYTKALGFLEIQQNFQAIRNRYGI